MFGLVPTDPPGERLIGLLNLPEVISQPCGPDQPVTVDLDDRGDIAIELGRYTLLLADGAIADRGKYLVVWKQQDDGWRLYRDIWNSNEPPR